MSISFTRYVDIVSGVGAGANVPERKFIARLITDNPLLPPQSFIEFSNNQDSAANVGRYFGFDSEEYKRAAFQFAWVSKNITQVPSISFARWVDIAQAGVVFGKPGTYALATFTPITTGALNLTIGATTFQLTAIDLHLAGSLAAVATDIQTAIRAHSGGGTDWTGAVVAFDATRGSFSLTGGVAGAEAMAVLPANTGVDLAPLLGWTTGAIVGKGSAVETITQMLTETSSASNNFGSFDYLTNLALTQSEIVEGATWNNGQNVKFQYSIAVSASNYAAISAAIIGLAGSEMTLVDETNFPNEYDEMVPMMILAATNYDGINSVQNYMFQQFALTAKVTTDADADTYDAARVNYYGNTQQAGQLISFYQRGQMTGGSTAPVDMNTYANEQWLKDSAGAQIMTLLLGLAAIGANAMGRSQILTVLQQGPVTQALRNGTFSIGKILTPVQKLFITNATGNPTAWYQVQNQGYWLDVQIVPFVDTSGATEYKAVYTLIYSKDDVIRLVDGTHVLI